MIPKIQIFTSFLHWEVSEGGTRNLEEDSSLLELRFRRFSEGLWLPQEHTPYWWRRNLPGCRLELVCVGGL